MPWFHVCCCAGSEGEREKAKRKMEEGNTSITVVLLNHSQGDTLTVNIVPPCPDTAGKPCSSYEWGHWV